MSEAHHYWVDGQVIIVDGSPVADGLPKGCANVPCLDASETFKRLRYGHYTAEKGWKSMNPEDFPPQFKLSLLLLGVS